MESLTTESSSSPSAPRRRVERRRSQADSFEGSFVTRHHEGTLQIENDDSTHVSLRSLDNLRESLARVHFALGCAPPNLSFTFRLIRFFSLITFVIRILQPHLMTRSIYHLPPFALSFHSTSPLRHSFVRSCWRHRRSMWWVHRVDTFFPFFPLV